jgi:hypothetical protein
MWPVASVGFASVSHWPPTTEMLSIHPQITRELRSYFYSIVNVRFTLGCAFQQWQFYKFIRFPDSEKRHMRNVEVLFLIGDKTVNTSEVTLCADLRHRVKRLCNHFSAMSQLKTIVINWTDLTGSGFEAWDMKASVIREFKQLRKVEGTNGRSVSFTVGKVVVEDEDERKWISSAIGSLMTDTEQEGSEQRLDL